MTDDTRWMARAIGLARGALGSTAPNPAVGAVLVRDGRVLGEGHTQPVGGPHAEIVALRAAAAAGEDVRGATLFVTLEPCCHHGRTPPCTDALIAAGVSRVVAGVEDPFHQVAGRGVAQLRAAGLAVEVGQAADDCRALVLGFARAQLHGLPEVSAKVGCSLDGAIATAEGESQWITGERARAHAHGLRAEHDAILVGVGTLLADDPRLTCRTAVGRDPVPVVLDSNLRSPPSAAAFAGPRRALVVCAEDAPERDLPAEILRVPRVDGRVGLEPALRALAARGLHRVLVEGGAEVHRALLDASLVDTLHVYLADLLLPGGRRWVGGPPAARLAEGRRLGPPRALALGDDVLLSYAPAHAWPVHLGGCDPCSPA